MSEQRYEVRFSGELKPGIDQQTAKSNIVLDTGLSEDKVEKLFGKGQAILKRCATIAEAQRIVDRFDNAGVVCVIIDLMQKPSRQKRGHGVEVGSESSLFRILKSITPGESGSKKKKGGLFGRGKKRA